MQAQLVFERSVRELNPVSVLTEDVCCRNTYRPFKRSQESCGGWNRTNIKTFKASRPTVRRPRNRRAMTQITESALRESNPPRQLGRLGPLPLGQEHIRSAACGT